MNSSCYIGVDVGTGSARASLLSSTGTLLASSSHPITTWRSPTSHVVYEQSTADIWNSICICVHTCLERSGVAPENVRGIGFDGTCSMGVCDWDGNPVCVTAGENLGKQGERNVILWADHRAEAEAERINKTGSVVLDYVGGTMSLEMEIPKLLWLKTHMQPDLFKHCQFFDLPDYLVYLATGSYTRSVCSLTCKCSYVPDQGWNSDFFASIGLEELTENGYKQIGQELSTAGRPVGKGLVRDAAKSLGLVEGTPVGSGLIDAYAGWLGTIAARYKDANGQLSEAIPSLDTSSHRLATVAGTSTCHLVQSPKGVFVNGVWGPYKDAVFEDWWMNEGGQSSTGQLIDHILTTHPAYPELVERGKQEGKDIHLVLQDKLEQLRAEAHVDSLTELTKDLHVYPDFHGNRSPIADPRMRGAIVGLDLDISISDLAHFYHATLTAIALQTRSIIASLNTSGHAIDTIYVSGSQARNPLLMRLIAECCGMSVVLPGENEGDAVVRGAAMLGRFAVEVTSSMGRPSSGLLWRIMCEMTPSGTLLSPSLRDGDREKKLLEVKYQIFKEQVEMQKRWRSAVERALDGTIH